jgi:hypothetical protein
MDTVPAGSSTSEAQLLDVIIMKQLKGKPHVLPVHNICMSQYGIGNQCDEIIAARSNDDQVSHYHLSKNTSDEGAPHFCNTSSQHYLGNRTCSFQAVIVVYDDRQVLRDIRVLQTRKEVLMIIGYVSSMFSSFRR